MRVIAFNGSPRLRSTTATLLRKALEGAAWKGAETEFIHLDSIRMKGCLSCFACKLRGGSSYGRCKQRDGMTPLYAKIEAADAIILGTPIYFGSVTAQAKLFLDRLYPYISYADHKSIFPKKIHTGVIFTAGISPEYQKLFEPPVKFVGIVLGNILGPCETMWSVDTMHVKDYTKIVADSVEPQLERKFKHQREVFPKDCEKAFEMGARFASGPPQG